MSLILDASVTLSWYFDDERSGSSDAIMDRVARQGAIVPILWYYEVANGLLVATRRNRITPDYRRASLADLRVFPIDVDTAGADAAWTVTLDLADRFGLTIYDAVYLELAQRRRLPLASADLALQSAAQNLAIDVLG